MSPRSWETSYRKGKNIEIIVLKFGGVAMRDYPERVVNHIIRHKKSGYGVVAVVSAEAGVTDSLLQKAKGLTPNPNERTVDLLLSTGEQISATLIALRLQKQGHDAIALTGWQAGIVTDEAYGNAEITGVNPHLIMNHLAAGKIAVVMGFQGITPEGEITTLGRGGSDYTAKFLELALDADRLELYKEVDGVMSADPKKVPGALQRSEVTPRELLELANGGAKVVNADCARLISQGGVTYIRSVIRDVPGTLIVPIRPRKKNGSVTGITSSRALEVSLVDTGTEHATELFATLGGCGVSVDIVHVSSSENSILFTTSETMLQQTEKVCEAFVQAHGGSTHERKVAIIRIVGEELQEATGIMGEVLSILEEVGISNPLTPTSEITISVVIPEDQEGEVVRILHRRLVEEKEMSPTS